MKAERLIALKGQPPAADTRWAEEVARETYGVLGTAHPLDGERDRNFRIDAAGGRFVLKFIDHEADENLVAGQTAVLKHLAETGSELSLPRIVPTRTGNAMAIVDSGNSQLPTCRVRLVTYVPGDPLLDAIKARKLDSNGLTRGQLLQSAGREIARLDRALTGFFHPSLAQPIAWDVRRASMLSPVLPEVHPASVRRLIGLALDPLERVVNELRGLRSQAIHGDCHPRNLLISTGGGACDGIVDLGDMIHAPLVLEIAVTMAEFLATGTASLEALPELLAGYTRVQPLESAALPLLPELIGARIAVGLLIDTWRQSHLPNPPATSDDATALAVAALEQLASRAKERLIGRWTESATMVDEPLTNTASRRPTQTSASRAVRTAPRQPRLLERRRSALGAGAELSYHRPLHLVRGEGVWVHTEDGERLLDVYNNVPHVGHAHPAVVEAIARQAGLIASNTRYLDERIIEYVERLTTTLPAQLNACLFVNSGSEANDIAWRIAKCHTGHHGALVMTHAYHGITEAIAALSPAINSKPQPHVEQIASPGFPDLDSAESALARLSARGFSPAALMLDSALTSSGIFDPPPDWIEPIALAVRQAGGLIIADEVQFGLGRSGSNFWGFERRGHHPDIVTLGKPVANGYPLGVVITRRDILEAFQKRTGFFSTFGGNPVAGAAGLAVLDVLQREGLQANAQATGVYFTAKLRELATKYPVIREVRGCGLLLGVEVPDRPQANQLVNGLRDRGVLIGSEGPNGNVLKLRPPMPFGHEHADLVVAALRETLAAF